MQMHRTQTARCHTLNSEPDIVWGFRFRVEMPKQTVVGGAFELLYRCFDTEYMLLVYLDPFGRGVWAFQGMRRKVRG